MGNEKENGSGVKEKCTGERKKQSGEMDMMEETGWKHYLRLILNIVIPLTGWLLICLLGPKLLKFFMPFVIGWVIAMIANPLVRFLERRVKLVRRHSSIVIVAAALALVIGLLYLLVSRTFVLLRQFIIDLPGLYAGIEGDVARSMEQLEHLFDFMPDSIQQSWAQFGNNLGSYMGTVVEKIASPTVEAAGTVAKSLPAMLVYTVVTILSAYFFIVDRDRILAAIKAHMPQWAGRYVKNAYDDSLAADAPTLDVDLSVMLKAENKVFKIEKHTHSYPHCWRTDKPVLYYPLDSWFIRTTALRDRMIELNKTIRWKPESTGTGRFGKWLEGLVDWNLSRSRFWGTPLPIWATEDYSEMKCIGSVEELVAEIEKSVAASLMKENPYKNFKPGDLSKENYSTDRIDLHRPYVDNIVLVSSKGEPMRREPDLIDVWFDSGAMPYAQLHYPFEHGGDYFKSVYPADFIAEGVDQTRGWFFTLHAIATMLFDSVAFKNIISNGLVLDKNGNKMSKRLGNAVDPFEILSTYGADATRWYMISNSQPWDNLKFDRDGVDEVRRKFFGTLYNTYSFFALYANVDGFTGQEPEVPMSERPEIDRWIISLLNTLVRNVTESLENYDPTPAARMIQEFVCENLSNWYVRLNRKRFWGGGLTRDKLAAYQTLYTCLETVSMLSAPFAPFISDRIFRDLNAVSGRHTDESVHLSTFPVCDSSLIDGELEQMMSMAQQVSSMVLALRRKVNIKVRQPLTKILIPVLDADTARRIEAVKGLIMSEVNVKEIELIENTTGLITKRIKPNFKTLGPKYGKQMKQIAALVAGFSQDQIAAIEASAETLLDVDGEKITVTPADFEITSEDMPGWLVATEGKLTVALDITITDDLRAEGIARELINRIQNIRKDSGFEVTDKIRVEIEQQEFVLPALKSFADYIASQTLAVEIEGVPSPSGEFVVESEVDEQPVRIAVTKI